MIDIYDKGYMPNLAEISEFIGNPLFDELCEYITAKYKALYDIAYSGDNVLLGWNVSFRKAGRALCRLYPREGFFSVLLVVGRKEKQQTEALLPQMSGEMRSIYSRTQEGMGQRWLIFDMESHDALYDDLLTLIDIRRNSR